MPRAPARRTMKALLFSLVLLGTIALPAAQPPPPAGPAPYHDRMQWWGDARFGLFIHWGPVSLKGTEIGWSRGGARLDPMDTVIRLQLDGSAMDIPGLAQGAELKPTVSNVFQQQTDDYGPQHAFDHDPHTRWATDRGTKQAWIAADLGQPRAIQRVRIEEAAPYDDRVRQFEFQYRNTTGWKTLFTGTTLGRRFQKQFPPVTARELRLHILDASEGPALAELEFVERRSPGGKPPGPAI